MYIINNIISLISLYSFFLFSINQEISDNYSLNNINSLLLTDNCSSFNDCFNCSLISTCRWNSSIEKCIPYKAYNLDYSIVQFKPLITNNILSLNNYFNFLRKSCFLPTTPMIKNINSKIYNYDSVKYCGNHYIMTTDKDLDNEFKIELKKVNGKYATPNLLCEYILFSGPNFFDVEININQEESNNFYLLYSEDSINFTKILNSSTKLDIYMNLNKLNTFIFYSLKSFDSPPFTITYKTNFWSKTVQATGYIMLALIILIIVIIIYAIIYMRKNSTLFNKINKVQSKTERQKYKNNINNRKSEEITLMKKRSNETNITSPSFIKNYNPETPVNLFEDKKFSYEKCVVDGQYFNNNDEIYKPNCGHFYHKNCYNNLIKDNLNEKKEVRCIICQQIIYP